MMELEIINLFSLANKKESIERILKCNEYTSEYGLTLTYEQASDLVKTNALVVKGTGRIEMGLGIADKIIENFHNSPYISSYNYLETISDLVELFYIYKNESLDRISDDELIEFMKSKFDGDCQGSLTLLKENELINLVQKEGKKYGE